MSRLLVLFVFLFCGCFRARVEVELFGAGDGSIGVELALDRGKIPALFGDPLAGVGTPEDLRRYDGPGIVAWAEPTRGRDDSWETLNLRAYFDDINKLRFLRERAEGEVAELLRFQYDSAERPGEIALIHDLEPELGQPLPIPEQPGSKIDPEMMRQAVGMLKPMLGDLELSLRMHLPGEVQRAPGFHERIGRDAILRAGRDPVLRAVGERAGALLDEAAFLSEMPPRIVWQPAAERPAERSRHDAARLKALEWWSGQKERADSGR